MRKRSRATNLVHGLVRQAIAGEVLSVASLLRRPVIDTGGGIIGKVADFLVRWDSGIEHPPLEAVLADVGRSRALISTREIRLEQTAAHLLAREYLLADATAATGVLLARDVLDHQLVDITGAEVVRAADVYLARVGDGWELAGIDIGLGRLLRRILPRSGRCPVPERVVDWAELQSFSSGAGGAGSKDSSEPVESRRLQLASPVAGMRTLRAQEIIEILSTLGTRQQAAFTEGLGTTATAQAALRELSPSKLEALLDELDENDRSRFRALVAGDEP